MIKTLEGIKVIDFTLAAAGPFAGRMLKACGAESILVEPLQGTHTRVLLNYDYICSGKRSLTLNAKTPEGQEVMRRLIEKSDVFLSNYRAQGLSHMNLSYEQVSEINPAIIYATIDGFGTNGPAKNSPGYDGTAFWARGSMLHTLSEGDTVPVVVSTVGDITAGIALWGGICAALYNRQITGKGMRVYDSLLQLALTLNFDAISQGQHGDHFPHSRLTPYRALNNTYKCKDGKWIVMTIPTLEKFFKLLRRLGRDDLVESGRWHVLADVMGDGVKEVVEILDSEFAKITRDEALSIFRELDLACEPVQSVHEVVDDEQILANQYLYKIFDTVNKQDVMLPPMPPVKFGNDDVDEFVRGPRLGEHSVEILKELEFTDSEIADMISKKVTSDGSKEDLYIRK